jgi:hypothetical protein
MTAHRDPDRLIHDFLMEGQTELADPVYDAVRDRIETTRQRAVIGSWRTPDMNRFVAIGLGTAGVIAVILLGSQLIGTPAPGGPGVEATPTPSVEPSPSATVGPAGNTYVEPGPFALAQVGDLNTIAMSVIVTEPEWYGDVGGQLLVKNDNPDPPDGAGLIVFTGQLEVYGDPCKWATTRPDPMTGATVDEVIAALAAQADRNATEPVDVTVDGHAGKSITLHVPTDQVFTGCDLGQFRSWGPEEMSRYHQGPGQIDQVWVVDVDGTLTTIDAGWYEGTPADVRAELDAILASLTFE